MDGYSEYTQSALEILRDPQKTMHWYIVPLLLITMYIVTKQLHEKNYKVVLGGFALWGQVSRGSGAEYQADEQ